MLKMHRAKLRRAPEVEIWGTGRPRREFLHVDDLADALVFLMERYSDDSHVNVGWGTDVTIAELARLVAAAVGYGGGFRYASDKPDGVAAKTSRRDPAHRAGLAPAHRARRRAGRRLSLVPRQRRRRCRVRRPGRLHVPKAPFSGEWLRPPSAAGRRCGRFCTSVHSTSISSVSTKRSWCCTRIACCMAR